jgi:hypothetical protein
MGHIIVHRLAQDALALPRLYSGSVQAPFRLRSGSAQALLRLCSGSNQVRSPSAQGRSPLAQVKAAATHV